MKRSEKLYLILNRATKKLIAYTDDLQVGKTYVNQFRYNDNEFNLQDVEFKTLEESMKDELSKIRYIENYYNQMKIQEIAKGFYLTGLEWDFYRSTFLELYETIKDTIAGMYLLEAIETESDLVTKLGELKTVIYERYKSFDLFMDDIDRKYIFRNIILTPIATQEFNRTQSELIERYKYLIEKE